MNSVEVTNIINTICKEIGIGVEKAKEIIPLFAKYKVVGGVECIVVGLIFLIVAALLGKLAKYSLKESKENPWSDWDFDMYISIVGCIIACVIGICLITRGVREAVEWSMFPEVKTVEYILNAIGKK